MWSVAGRILGSLAVLGLVSLVLFVLVRTVPVSPARIVLGPDATEEDVAEFDRERGLDRPLLAQYGEWVRGALTGDLGRSYVDDSAISSEIARSLPITLELVTLAFLLAVAIGVPLGALSAYHERGPLDHASRILAVVGVSIPGFWLGLMLIAFGAVTLRWFPPGGYVPIREGLSLHLRALVLPALALGLYYVAIISRMTRSSVSDVLSQDHVRVARAMGLSRSRILLYVLKNAMAPVLTVAAMSYGYMFGWALVIEHVFNLAGMSRALLNAIFRRDYLVVQAIVLIITAIFLAANLVADLLYRWLDPRLRA
jgi:peptide/nickel transport system permease protein